MPINESQPTVPLLQPRLSHVLTHLQPNLAECVLGTDPANLRLVHLDLRESSPLLIQGEPALGMVDLAVSLLVQLYAMNDASHLLVVLLDRSAQLASLVQFLPQTSAVALSEQDMLRALKRVNPAADRSRQGGTSSPLTVVVVNDFGDLRPDTNAWSAFLALAEHGHERGIALIALSKAGAADITSLFRQRIAFPPGGQAGTAFGSDGEPGFSQTHAAHQRGQFLVESVGRQGATTLVLPLIDILALHIDGPNGVRFLQRSPSPIACAALEATFQFGGACKTPECMEVLAGHVLACSRCRHGILPSPGLLPGIASLDCSACSSLLPTYYEATHPNHSQVTMQAAELAQVAMHLGQCLACCEVWGTLVQLSVLEEEGEI